MYLVVALQSLTKIWEVQAHRSRVQGPMRPASPQNHGGHGGARLQTLQDEVTGSVLFGVQFPSVSERPMLEQKANNPAFLTMRTSEGRKKPGAF